MHRFEDEIVDAPLEVDVQLRRRARIRPVGEPLVFAPVELAVTWPDQRDQVALGLKSGGASAARRHR